MTLNPYQQMADQIGWLIYTNQVVIPKDKPQENEQAE